MEQQARVPFGTMPDGRLVEAGLVKSHRLKLIHTLQKSIQMPLMRIT